MRKAKLDKCSVDHSSNVCSALNPTHHRLLYLANQSRCWVFFRILSRMTEPLPTDLTPPHHLQTGEGDVNRPQQLPPGYSRLLISSLNPITGFFCPLLSLMDKQNDMLTVNDSFLFLLGKLIKD